MQPHARSPAPPRQPQARTPRWADRRNGLPATSRLLCVTSLVRFGTFAVHPSDPRFSNAGEYYGHEIVFPRCSVWIHRPGRPPILADPTMVMFYNHGDPYTRSAASARGDHCEWMALDTATLIEIVASVDPGAEERPGRPFAFGHGPSDPTSYRLQRLAAERAAAGEADPLDIEELTLRIVARVARAAAAAHGLGPPAGAPAPPSRRARELAERVRLVLADRWAEPLGLAELAREVSSSPFHLCRAFKAAHGMGVARYRCELRLRHALERVAEPDADLSRIALDVGFATHSHFTAAFRATFGEPPSAFRRAANGRRLREARVRLRALGAAGGGRYPAAARLTPAIP